MHRVPVDSSSIESIGYEKNVLEVRFRNGGLPELWLRMESGELRPDAGPELPHRTAGATLVTARPPLAA